MHSATKLFPFTENSRRELIIGADIRRKRKVEKITEFAAKIKQIQEKARIVLKQVQEEMKKQADRERKAVESQRKEDQIMLSTKDLVFKEQPVRKLVDHYVKPYTNKEVVSTNAVQLKLPTTMRIHPVVNIS